MRLRLFSADPERSPFWLIGDPALPERAATADQHALSEILTGTFQLTRTQQTVPGAEWDTVLNFDRGNQRLTFDASAHLEFINEVARLDYLAALGSIDPDAQTHDWFGDVWLRIPVNLSTGTFKDYLLPDATVQLVGNQLIGAVSLQLTYRVSAGGFSTLSSTGTERVSLSALQTETRACVLRIYGTGTGGDFADGTRTIGADPSGDITGTFTVQGIDNLSTDELSKTFQVVSPGGSASGGNIAVSYPVANLLAAIAAAYSAETLIEATVISPAGERPYVELVWTQTPTDPAECRLTVTAADFEYNKNGTDTAAESLQVTLQDDNEVTLIADTLD